MPPLHPDCDQLDFFVETLFQHAPRDTYVSLRSFSHDNSVFRVTPVYLNGSGSLANLTEAAIDDASAAANAAVPVVFCPPVAVFNNGDKAREQDLAAGLTLSVELDRHPIESLDKLEAILGPATIVVRSGGVWTNGGSKSQDKLHAHWLLAKPAIGEADIAKLKAARKMATMLVEGDESSVAIVHPMRWPGSWHRKEAPRLCEITRADPKREIDLDETFEALRAAGGRLSATATSGTGTAAAAPLVELDQPSAIAAATEWLEQSAPEAIEGSGGDNTTFTVACRVKDFGVSESTCLELMTEHWNSKKAQPPWGVDELEKKVSNAYQYGKLPGGIKSPEAEFKAVEGEAEEKPARRLSWAPIASWDRMPRPVREWVVRDRVPRRQVGLFSGEGGTGKSLVELGRNAAHGLGKDWYGAPCLKGPTLYLGCEDELDELHIRLGCIADYLGVTFSDLEAGGVHVQSFMGEDAVLCAVNPRSGKVETTKLYKELYEAAGDIKPVNISLDTLSRVFAGNEIDRVQVYAFANHMQALALAANGSVTVLSHPSLSGMNSGSGLSGSTAWHGAFRFRFYLTSAAKEDAPDTGLRRLAFKKNQYGPTGETLALRYTGGIYALEPNMTEVEQAEVAAMVEAEFMTRLDQFTSQGRIVSHKPRSGNYAPRLFAEEDDGGPSKIEYEKAMSRLFVAGRIRVEIYNKWQQERVVRT